jgi:hypothetical protein
MDWALCAVDFGMKTKPKMKKTTLFLDVVMVLADGAVVLADGAVVLAAGAFVDFGTKKTTN